MKEYIEREALYRFLTEQKNRETGAYSKGRNAGLNVARSALHNREITPAADVVEARRGRWEEKEFMYGDVYYDCSVCGESFCLIDGTPTDNLYNFCPNCGADMREEVNRAMP